MSEKLTLKPKRPRPGRPPSEPTVILRVPVGLVDVFKQMIDIYRRDEPVFYQTPYGIKSVKKEKN